MGINCMSLAVWLEDRRCSAAVVGLDLVLGLSIVRRCSLKRSFKKYIFKTVSSAKIWDKVLCVIFLKLYPMLLS